MVKISLFIVLIIAFVGANAMSKNNKTCLFSAISGTITLNGKPVANARIKRVSGNQTDESTTNESGYFNMPSVFKNSISSAITKFLPGEFASPQELYVYVQGMEYKILDAVKRKDQEFSESKGNPWIVSCELTDENRNFTINNSPFLTLCKWDAEHDRKIDLFPKT